MAPCGPSKSHKALFMNEMLVGAVGIELKATLKIRKLLIPLDSKNAKTRIFAQPRYTRGTQWDQKCGWLHKTQLRETYTILRLAARTFKASNGWNPMLWSAVGLQERTCLAFPAILRGTRSVSGV